ncbi:SidA/IucD/PvdA family monooxygenase [Gordonia sp. HNM0687]|uniref:SidA/IucD/PvdA family monooxygenase n=1 Tax=Gordonia mangrovi TaxID=2665643 RepID=A0A6L7GLL7_9ACTN|nr:NAD(P)-binding domain-containing protein [Gordonia mangrovi]MXP20794.1 SidA/IucD/PvdA family monooxygenase [Gordonia mangrovi]UVF78639.1 NAD(P)/FAD-dependent oxidoreductase [Gordonia mangrovi]
MRTEQIDTVIVGAGQAGLATAYHLRNHDRPCLVLDANTRVGDNWRRQWDSLRLYSPARYDGLPGMPFPATGWSFPGKDDVADYLEAYAHRFRLPVRLSTRVRSVDPDAHGGFLVDTDAGTLAARNVVVATGTFGRTPAIPECASDLDPAILQLHSSEYRRPEQLRDGPTLVVGASHSGADIAYEVAATRPTILCGRDCGSIPVRPESWQARLLFPMMIFAWRHVLTRCTPIGRKQMPKVRFHGAPALRVKPADLRDRDVTRIEQRISGARDGRPETADGQVLDVANIVWCTGFRQVFDWIHLPVFGPDGWPEEMRGVVDDAPGLYFCGLSFQYAFSSMVLPGVGRDAAYIADRIHRRADDETTIEHQLA